MTSEQVLGHLAYKIANATVNPFPFPHIYVPEIFPWPFYEEIRDQLPELADYKGNVDGKYKSRVFNDAKLPLLDPLRGKDFTNIACHPFRDKISKRFGGSFEAGTDLRLVSDAKDYSIGPHTDAPNKVLSFLFYLPHSNEIGHLGTSIYLPIDQTFRCEGGPHYPYENFVKIATMPYMPNSLFAFFKTNFSFHGVEPITMPVRRDVLLWNLYGKK